MTDSKDRSLSLDEQTLTCHEKGLFSCQAPKRCYNFLQICDQICDCPNDCTDESQCKESFQTVQSPILLEHASNDFWRVVKLPPNRTLSLRVPFATRGKLFLQANSLGSRGVATLGSRLVSIGTNVRFHMELPERIKTGEIVSLRISGVNQGNIPVRRTFGIYSSAIKSFTFISVNGHQLVSL